MKNQFKGLRFKSEKEFSEWLNSHTYKIVRLADNGQDLLCIWLHKSGEIIHCNAQSGIWNGKFVDMEKLEVGVNLFFDGKEMNFIAESIID